MTPEEMMAEMQRQRLANEANMAAMQANLDAALRAAFEIEVQRLDELIASQAAQAAANAHAAALAATGRRLRSLGSLATRGNTR